MGGMVIELDKNSRGGTDPDLELASGTVGGDLETTTAQRRELQKEHSDYLQPSHSQGQYRDVNKSSVVDETDRRKAFTLAMNEEKALANPRKNIELFIRVLRNLPNLPVNDLTKAGQLRDIAGIFKVFAKYDLIEDSELQQDMIEALRPYRDWDGSEPEISNLARKNVRIALLALGDPVEAYDTNNALMEIDSSIQELLQSNDIFQDAIEPVMRDRLNDLASMLTNLSDPKLQRSIAKGILDTKHPHASAALAENCPELLRLALGQIGAEDVGSLFDLIGRVRVGFESSPESKQAIGIIGQKIFSLEPQHQMAEAWIAALNGATDVSRSHYICSLVAALGLDDVTLLPEKMASYFSKFKPSESGLEGSLQAASYADVLRRAHRLGLNYPFRVSPELLEEVVGNLEAVERNGAASDARPSAIVVIADVDYNGASYGLSGFMSDLWKHNYQVLVYEAANESELIKGLKKGSGLGSDQEKKADVIIFAGHGEKAKIFLGMQDPVSMNGNQKKRNVNGAEVGTPEDIDIKDLKLLRESGISGVLRRGGQVAAISCSTGAGEERGANIGNMLRKLFPQAVESGIYTPMIPVSSSGISGKFDPNTNELKEIIMDVPEVTYHSRLSPNFRDSGLNVTHSRGIKIS